MIIIMTCTIFVGFILYLLPIYLLIVRVYDIVASHWFYMCTRPLYPIVFLRFNYFVRNDEINKYICMLKFTNIFIIIKSEVSTLPIVIIFFRGCVPEMFVASYSVTYCVYVPGKPGICFHHYCAVYDECKYSDTFWLADRTRLFAQYTI